MKAISKHEHLALISHLQKLQEQYDENILHTDGILHSMQSLRERYTNYEELLTQLYDCISEYKQLSKEVRMTIITPVSRKTRKRKMKLKKSL